jgi:hypothetical protein
MNRTGQQRYGDLYHGGGVTAPPSSTQITGGYGQHLVDGPNDKTAWQHGSSNVVDRTRHGPESHCAGLSLARAAGQLEDEWDEHLGSRHILLVGGAKETDAFGLVSFGGGYEESGCRNGHHPSQRDRSLEKQPPG